MRVLVSGASGLIGTELCTQLAAAGHTVARLVRREPRGADEFRWDPTALSLDENALEGIDAVINLSGASIARLPWTKAYRREILDSRVQATRTLTDAMHRRTTPPATLLNASAVGVYGDRPNEVLTDDSPAGTDFLAKVTTAWEAEAHRAPEPTRVVALRTGLVIARGGALKPLLPIVKLGLGGPLGRGTQHWPWISLHDEAAAIVHLLTSTLSGSVNLVGPTPATANDVIRAVAAGLHRPFLIPVPEFVLTLALQEAARALLLADQRIVPDRLQEDGFVFAHRTAAESVHWMLSRP
ncbi:MULTISPECIES: TIGR01777 family oxidoreductase [Cryobacterium]|uniref:TIGR01777 family protein n=1 Tax=Cryobacterium breve TaxID=1259258 RepID=A0ABY2J9C4_9MICO|nr:MULTISPECIES: TIGR01777 family oxidoreductase [Cryobacterium]TFC97807.1 TIGR01777 family protein [Cryobacterium sp. TmT3-12]TFD01555.1 TIGR01777 family protein [Cryobacterium breve]